MLGGTFLQSPAQNGSKQLWLCWAVHSSAALVPFLTLFQGSFVQACLDQIKDLIVKKLGVDREKLVDDQPMTEFGLDSLSQAELLFEIEEHFKISVPENKYIVFTLKDLAMAVTEILEAPSSKDSIVAEMPKEKPLAPEITLSENPK